MRASGSLIADLILALWAFDKRHCRPIPRRNYFVSNRKLKKSLNGAPGFCRWRQAPSRDGAPPGNYRCTSSDTVPGAHGFRGDTVQGV